MLAALALIWFLLFVPAWTKRSEQKGDAARERQAQREKLSRSVSAGVAIKAAKVSRTKLVSLSLAVIGAAVAVVALIQGDVLISAISASVFVISGLVNLAANKRLRELVLEGARMRNKVASGVIGKSTVAKKPQAIETVADDKKWTPDEVPTQVFGRAGTLEEVVLAEVVELPKSEELDSKTLDEILRRRRAN